MECPRETRTLFQFLSCSHKEVKTMQLVRDSDAPEGMDGALECGVKFNGEVEVCQGLE
jgi:hypothetical protein